MGHPDHPCHQAQRLFLNTLNVIYLLRGRRRRWWHSVSVGREERGDLSFSANWRSDQRLELRQTFLGRAGWRGCRPTEAEYFLSFIFLSGEYKTNICIGHLLNIEAERLREEDGSLGDEDVEPPGVGKVAEHEGNHGGGLEHVPGTQLSYQSR